MTEYNSTITDSSMKPLRRIVVELYEDDDFEKLVTIEKTDDNGDIFFDGDLIKGYVIDPDKYAANKKYRKTSIKIEAIATHTVLTAVDENRYIVIPEYKGVQVNNITCTWYDKNDKVLGSDTSSEYNACDLFVKVAAAQPAYFKLTTKKGEKKQYKDADSRYNYKPPIEMIPQAKTHVKIVPV